MADRRDTVADTGRAEAFSDAIFAIVITLLVLDLRPPEVEPGRLLSGLLHQWPTYLAYVISYLYVGVVWTNHKAAFRRIRLIDRGLHWANLGILFTTALLPFPTAVISKTMQSGNRADERTAVGFYALIGALLCLSWLIFYRYLARHRELVERNVPEGYFAGEQIRALAGVALYAAAGVLGYLIGPPAALAVFLGLPVFYGLTSEGLYELPALIRRQES
ncbi:MAG: DUF1211 domain-containing protein [Nitrospirae bacterium]|nr:DUF1211 domain-containing protein [Candidatus Manganitrophaceae bacterium]